MTVQKREASLPSGSLQKKVGQVQKEPPPLPSSGADHPKGKKELDYSSALVTGASSEQAPWGPSHSNPFRASWPCWWAS